MTAIIGVEYGGRVYLGGDTASSLGDTVMPNPDPKVWEAFGVVMGAAGLAMRCQQLRYLLKVRAYRKTTEPEAWLARVMIPELAKLFNIKGPDDETNISILIGVGGRLFFIDECLGFCGVGPVFAIGSGGEMAWAAWDALPMRIEKIPERIEAALSVPARRLSSVCKPFNVVVK